MSADESKIKIVDGGWSKQEKFVLEKLDTISDDIKSMSHEVQEIKLQMANNKDQQKRIELLEKDVDQLRIEQQRIFKLFKI